MKKAFLLLTLGGLLVLGACSRKTCPAYSSAPKAPAEEVAQRV